MSSEISLSVTHRSNTYRLSCLPDDALTSIYERLEELTLVPVPNQKLLVKGRKLNQADGTTIREAGLRDGVKLTMLGATPKEVDGVQKIEDEQRRRDRVLRERASRGGTKVRVQSCVSTVSITHTHMSYI